VGPGGWIGLHVRAALDALLSITHITYIIAH